MSDLQEPEAAANMSLCFTYCTHCSSSSTTYKVSFFDYSIFTTVTHHPEVVTDWILEVEDVHHCRLPRLIVGLDVEWRPNFTRGQPRYPVATLQLCVGHRCLIYQIQHATEIPQALRDFLSSKSRYTFVGVGVGQDLEKLKSDYEIGGDAYGVELGRVAAERYGDEELKNRGLKALGKMVMGVEMDKPKKVTLSRWDSHHLSHKQVQYATLDAFVSFEVGRILNASHYTN